MTYGIIVTCTTFYLAKLCSLFIIFPCCLQLNDEYRSCVKEEADVLGSLSLMIRTVSVEVRHFEGKNVGWIRQCITLKNTDPEKIPQWTIVIVIWPTADRPTTRVSKMHLCLKSGPAKYYIKIKIKTMEYF